MVKPYIHEFMGPVFETICQEYTFRTGVTGKYGSPITRIGKWRGADPVLKCPSDIDVVGINEADKTAVIGECKFRNRSFGKEECETLMDRARLLAPYRIEKSEQGFLLLTGLRSILCFLLVVIQIGWSNMHRTIRLLCLFLLEVYIAGHSDQRS